MKYKNSNLKKDFLNITKKLRLPAGDSKMFSTLENISKNKDKFFLMFIILGKIFIIRLLEK